MKFKETLIKYNELQTKTANSNLKRFQFLFSIDQKFSQQNFGTMEKLFTCVRCYKTYKCNLLYKAIS